MIGPWVLKIYEIYFQMKKTNSNLYFFPSTSLDSLVSECSKVHAQSPNPLHKAFSWPWALALILLLWSGLSKPMILWGTVLFFIFMPYNYHFFFIMRTFKTHSLSNFQIYNTVLLNIITMLYISSSELIHLINGNLYSLTNPTSLFPNFPLPVPGNNHSSLRFYELWFFSFHI